MRGSTPESIPGVFDRFADAVVVADFEGTIVYANPAVEGLLGYAPSELVGQPVEVLVPERLRERHAREREAYRTVPRARPMGTGLEIYARRKNGTEFPADVMLVPLEGGEGGAVAAIISDRSRTAAVEETLRREQEAVRLEVAARTAERDLVLEELRMSERKHRAFFELVPDPAYRTTLDGRILDVNPAFLEMFGYTRAELAQLRAQDFYVDPHDRKWFEQAIARTRHIRNFLVRLRGKDGRERHCLLTSAVERSESGEPVGYVGFVRDVTALREAERRLRQVLDAAPLILFALDRYGTFVFSDGRGLEALGLSPGQLVGRSVFEVYADEPEVLDAVRRALAGEEFSARIALHKLDLVYHVVYTPVLGPKGRPAGTLGVALDVTELARLEEQVARMERLDSVGRLAGGIAHDLNNLLTVVLANCDVAQEALDPEHPVRPVVHDIREACGRAADLTRKILAFSRRQVLRPRVLDLNAALRNMESMLRRTLGEDVRLVFRLDPHLGRTMADPGQIEQVVMNLAVNAREAMPHGGTLTIETCNVTLGDAYAARHPGMRPGAHVLLSVTDTGAGMDEETMAHMFEPFFTTKQEGTGLGLSTAYGIVKQSGGSIWAYSEVGKGTTFKIYLPCIEAPDVVAPEVPARPEPTSLTGTETVLVVEDDAAVRSVIARSLRRYGYTVLVAADGAEALRVTREFEGTIHLVIADVMLPDQKGPDVVKALEELVPGFRVLYISGYAPGALVERGLLRPRSAFLEKPLTPEQLARKVREVLGAADATANEQAS